MNAEIMKAAQDAVDRRKNIRADLIGLADELHTKLLTVAAETDGPEGSICIRLEISKTLAIQLDQSLRDAAGMI